MSWWVSLERDGKPVSVPRFVDGGTFKVAGSDTAELDITYNYSDHYREHLDSEEGLRWLDGKRADDCILRLLTAARALGTDTDPDYWKATPGNAGYALALLLGWAALHPDAVFRVFMINPEPLHQGICCEHHGSAQRGWTLSCLRAVACLLGICWRACRRPPADLDRRERR